MTKFHFLLILTCMMCMFYISCENAGLQGSIKGNAEIEYREIDDCDDCPQDYCCCTIEIDEGGGNAALDLCGVYTNTTATTPCGPFSNPPSPCSAIPSGLNSPIDLNVLTNPRDYFCLPFGGSFRIYNRGSIAHIKMTCQADDPTNPVYTYFKLDPTDEIYFSEAGSCLLQLCE